MVFRETASKSTRQASIGRLQQTNKVNWRIDALHEKKKTPAEQKIMAGCAACAVCADRISWNATQRILLMPMLMLLQRI
jgi:hypothetical protein